MTSLPEQLSAARSAQLEAQLALFHSLTTQAFDSASRFITLNISASRNSVERSSEAVRQLLTASDPRELANLRTHAEEQFRSLFAYSRELFSIASGAQAHALRQSSIPAALPAPAAPPVASPAAEVDIPATVAAIEQAVTEVAEPAAKVVEESVQAGQDAAAAATEAVKTEADAEARQLAAYIQENVEQNEAAIAVAAPVAEPADLAGEPAQLSKAKPIAKAAGKGYAKAAIASHPVAAPVVETAPASLPKIDPQPKRRK